MDKATLGGLILAVGGILLGLLIEGGNLGQVVQPTAAMIVFGGTLGAILIQYPLSVALTSFKRLIHVFVEPAQNAQSTVQLLVKYANQARREGIISNAMGFMNRLNGLFTSLAFYLVAILFGYISGDNPGPQPDNAARFLLTVFPPILMVISFAFSFFIDFKPAEKVQPAPKNI